MFQPWSIQETSTRPPSSTLPGVPPSSGGALGRLQRSQDLPSSNDGFALSSDLADEGRPVAPLRGYGQGGNSDDARARSVRRAMHTGKTVRFVNSNGKRVALSVSPHPPSQDGYRHFTVKMSGHELKISVGRQIRPSTVISRSMDYFSQYPKRLRGDLTHLVFHKGQSPNNPPGATAKILAEAGDGRIDFWRGLTSVKEWVFDHEFGHIVGDCAEDRQASAAERAWEQQNGYENESIGDQFTPKGYARAIRRDHHSVSRYGNTNRAEDWAEFWRLYAEAREQGGWALEGLRQQFPWRFRIADAVFEGRGYRA